MIKTFSFTVVLVLAADLLAQQPETKPSITYSGSGYTIQMEQMTFSSFTGPTGQTALPASFPKYIAYSPTSLRHVIGDGGHAYFREKLGRGIFNRRIYSQDGSMLITYDPLKLAVRLYDVNDRASDALDPALACTKPDYTEKLVGWEVVGGIRVVHYRDGGPGKRIQTDRWVWVEAGCDAEIQTITTSFNVDGSTKSDMRTIFRSVQLGEPDPRLFDTTDYRLASGVEASEAVARSQATDIGLDYATYKAGLSECMRNTLDADKDPYKPFYQRKAKDAASELTGKK